MDYMTLKEASKKWGISSRQINLLLRRWANSRCCENGYHLADTKECGKAG